MSGDDWIRGVVDGPVPTEADVPSPVPPAAPGSPEDPPEAPETDALLVTAREALAEWIAEERSGDRGTLQTGWPTIDTGLDRLVRRGEVVLLAARTGVGKTWAIQGILENLLIDNKEAGAIIVQMEMPAFHFAERLAVHALGDSPRRIRRQAQEHVFTANEIADKHPYLDRLLICERAVTVAQLPALIDQAREFGVEPTVVGVDYAGLFKTPQGGKRPNRYDKVSDDAKLLKEVAKTTRTIMLVAAQLSRGAGDGTVEPTLEDLRDSGVIEEAADRVLMFWRDAMVDETEAPRLADGLELFAKLSKNRFGPTGYRTHLRYDVSMRLVEQEAEQEALPY